MGLFIRDRASSVLNDSSVVGDSVADALDTLGMASGSIPEVSVANIENPATTSTNYTSGRRFWTGITKFVSLAWTWASKQTFTTAPRFSSTTANQVLEVDGNKDLVSAAKGTAFNKNFGTTSGTVTEGNDSRIGNAINLQGKLLNPALRADNRMIVFNAGADEHEYVERPISTIRCGAFSSISPTVTSGWSGALPLDSEIEDSSNMHKTTIEDSGTATGTHSSTTLQDTNKTWTVNQFAGMNVRITSGTGANQIRRITSNISNTLTVPTWTITPDNTSVYEIYITSRITAPNLGWYSVFAKVTFTGGGAGATRGIRIDVNGVFEANVFFPILGVENSITLVYGLVLNPGDYIEMHGYQDTGADKAMIGGKARIYLQVVGQ